MMKTIRTQLTAGEKLMIAALASATLMTYPVLANEQEANQAQHEVRATTDRVITLFGDGGDEKMQTISVNVNNDDVQVMLNGEVVPADRIKREGDQLIIVDENGEEIRSVRVWTNPALGAVARIEGNGGVLPNLEDHPPVMLGLSYTSTDAALESHLGLEHESSLMIDSVYEELPAALAGLKKYDVIVAINGEGPVNAQKLRVALDGMEADDAMDLTIISGGTKRVVEVRPTAYDSEKMRSAFMKNREGTFSFGTGAGAIPGNIRWRQLITDPNHQMFFVQPEVSQEAAQRLVEEAMAKARAAQEKLGHATQSDEDRLDELSSRIEELTQKLNELVESAQEEEASSE